MAHIKSIQMIVVKLKGFLDHGMQIAQRVCQAHAHRPHAVMISGTDFQFDPLAAVIRFLRLAEKLPDRARFPVPVRLSDRQAFLHKLAEAEICHFLF